MSKKVILLVVSCLMALTLFSVACGPAAAPTAPATPTSPTIPASPATPTAPATATPPVAEKPQQEAVKPSADAPKYGGMLTVTSTTDPLGWDYLSGLDWGGAATILTKQSLWAGDWAKGPAGGYGTKETGWETNGYDVWSQKTGYVAESWKWTIDEAKDEGTIVYQIRRGIRYSLDPANEASRLVNGRELTAEDVVFTLNTYITDPRAQLYRRIPELKVAKITKSGPWEVTIKVPVANAYAAIMRFGNLAPIFAQEVYTKWNGVADWKRTVGTGPFMLTDYVPGSAVTYKRNNNFWMKDPVGPGKGNQLPYLDSYKEIILPDASTREAALRTGKIETLSLSRESADRMRKDAPKLVELQVPGREAFAIKPVVDQPPFSDVRVRRALMMASDLNAINQSLNAGGGQILNYPIAYYKGYADVYLGLDDPEMPASVKELYTYNPEKAKALLKEAGYPNGFKTTALMTSAEVDIYSIYKDMWSKVGIILDFQTVEPGTKNSIILSGKVQGMTRNGADPIASWFTGASWIPGSPQNPGRINDSTINEAFVKINKLVILNPAEAKRQYRELLKYALDQAYAVPVSAGPTFRFWWPWLKNYSGESSVGYWSPPNWVQWVWIDQDLKKAMGR